MPELRDTVDGDAKTYILALADKLRQYFDSDYNVFFVLLLILLITYLIIYACISIYVKKHSLKYNALVTLNSSYRHVVEYLSKRYEKKYIHFCNSKAKLDKFNSEHFLIVKIEEDRAYYDSIIQTYDNNYHMFGQYLSENNNIQRLESLHSDILIKREEKLLKKNTLKIKNRFSISVKSSYTSPKGRNHYERNLNYNYFQIKNLHQQMNKLLDKKQTYLYKVKLERSKMTDSVRYNILKRDAHKCVICGATSNDGAKLQVDHIVPVSRGGKTTMSNLQTLCERCNSGKSNKI